MCFLCYLFFAYRGPIISGERITSLQKEPQQNDETVKSLDNVDITIALPEMLSDFKSQLYILQDAIRRVCK